MDDQKKTPLERYLEKQKGTPKDARDVKPPSSIEARRAASAAATQKKPGASPSPAAQPSRKSESTDMFKWAQPSAPAASPNRVPLPPTAEPPETAATSAPTPAIGVQQTPAATTFGQESELQPADIGTRAMAYAVDLVIVGVLDFIARKLFYGILGLVFSSFGAETTFAFDLIIWFTIVYYYYGTFYWKKGASPGKLLFNLMIVDEDRNDFVSVNKAFFREAVGKLMSTVPFGIGFLAALFRDDRRALHDLLFDTRVVRNIKQSRAENRR